MTSSQWPETRDPGGILSANPTENPYWWNANHVLVPYCTSDSWSGSRSSRTTIGFSFMGAHVVQQVIRDLVPLGLENSTELLLAGSSAGGTGAMINLDPVRELLHENLRLRHVAVRGVCDSGWFLDRAPYASTGSPHPPDAIRKGMALWQGKVPRRCRALYPNEPWRCYFGYRLYPTLRGKFPRNSHQKPSNQPPHLLPAPLFVFQWLFDEAQMTVDNVGSPVTKQQWDYIHKMGDALRHSFRNVTSVFAPSCVSHSVLTNRDWQRVKVNDVSVAQALHCWEQQPLRKGRNSNRAPPRHLNGEAALNNKRRRRRKHRNKNGRQGKNRGRKGQ